MVPLPLNTKKTPDIAVSGAPDAGLNGKKNNKNKRPVIGVCGLGYIGLPMAAAFASRGFRVIGVDVSREKVESLSRTYSSGIHEPGLDETLRKFRSSIEFTSSYPEFMEKADFILITVGTPLKGGEVPDYSYLESALTAIGKGLRRGQTVVLKSTVVPGTTEGIAKETLERLSSLRAGKDFHLAFCPERTIEGRALEELYTLPKIVGGITPESTEIVAETMSTLGGSVVKVSKPRTAEICKLVDNLYRAINIAFANEVGMLCENSGIDGYEVADAVNHSYSRTSIFKPGLGADGPCLSKDPQIFRYSALQNNSSSGIVEACITENQKTTMRVAKLVEDFASENKLSRPKVCMLGVAFKGCPETADLRGAPSLKILSLLRESNLDFCLSFYDPVVREFDGMTPTPSLRDALSGANIVLFLTNHPKVMGVDSSMLLDKCARPLLVVDCWHNIKNPPLLRGKAGIRLVRFGDGSA